MSVGINNEQYIQLKQKIKEWVISINEEEKLSEEIKALNFGLFEPYGIELIGAIEYNAEDDDWACEEDFVPNQRQCPNVEVSTDIKWEEFLNTIVMILKELIIELDYLDLFKVEHITTGFCDGDLVLIR